MTTHPASPNATPANISHPTERPSVKLKIPSGKSDILNSVVVGAGGQSLYTVARWHVSSHSDDLDMEIFQEALVEAGLLQAIVLSVVLLRSGRSLDADAAGRSNDMWYTQVSAIGSIN